MGSAALAPFTHVLAAGCWQGHLSPPPTPQASFLPRGTQKRDSSSHKGHDREFKEHLTPHKYLGFGSDSATSPPGALGEPFLRPPACFLRCPKGREEVDRDLPAQSRSSPLLHTYTHVHTSTHEGTHAHRHTHIPTLRMPRQTLLAHPRALPAEPQRPPHGPQVPTAKLRGNLSFSNPRDANRAVILQHAVPTAWRGSSSVSVRLFFHESLSATFCETFRR